MFELGLSSEFMFNSPAVYLAFMKLGCGKIDFSQKESPDVAELFENYHLKNKVKSHLFFRTQNLSD